MTIQGQRISMGKTPVLCGVICLGMVSACGVKEEVFQNGAGISDPGKPQLTFSPANKGLPEKGKWKSTSRIVDVNNDGFVDIVAHERLGKGPHVWLGNQQGTWVSAIEGLKFPGLTSCGGGVDVGDVNNDGYLDLAVADHCQGLFVYLGNGKGQWRATVEAMNSALSKKPDTSEDEMNPYSGAESLVLGDINEDGFLDIVSVASDLGGFSVYLGDGSGVLWKEILKEDGLPSGNDPESGDQNEAGWATDLLLHDMNGDGHLDLAAAYYAGPRVWLGNGKGQWEPAFDGIPDGLFGGIYWGIEAGDVNEDGKPDLVVSSVVNGPMVYLQKADGSWESSPDVMPRMKGGAYGLALDDLDGDGHLDIVVAGMLEAKSGKYGAFVLSGDGKGAWDESKTNLPETGLQITMGVAIGDLNGDRKPDVVLNSGGSNPDIGFRKDLSRVQVWLNNRR